MNHSLLFVVIHLKSLKMNNIMETKENLMQSMSEKQNEVVTEKFIADFALIDTSVVQKKSAWDIANENPTYSFVGFFKKDKTTCFITIETLSDLFKYVFFSVLSSITFIGRDSVKVYVRVSEERMSGF